MRCPTLLTLSALALLLACPVGGARAQVMPGATNGNALSPLVADPVPAAPRSVLVAPDAGGMDLARVYHWFLTQLGSPLRNTSRMPARARRVAPRPAAVRVP